jgi:superfamily II DNA or RNA helicase
MYKRAPKRAYRSIFGSGADTIHRQFLFSLPDDFELLFRLSAPEEEDTAWKLEHFMQSRGDPSLMYPLAMAVRGDSGGPGMPDGLRLVAMRRLGAAEKLTGLVPESFERPVPRVISPEEAYRFMSEDAPRLSGAGFSVQIPNILGNPARPRLVVKTKALSLVTRGNMQVPSVLGFDYRVALGDVLMTPEEFSVLSAGKEHLVRLRGKWVEFQPEVAEKLTNLMLEDRGNGTLPGTMSLSLRAAEEGIETSYLAGGKPVATFLDALGSDRRFLSQEPPPGFTGTLRPYQERGVGWLDFITGLGFGALLADDMGLGKTIQVIAHALAGKADGRRPFLIVCPTSVIGNWAAEFARFAPSLQVSIHHGAARDEGKDFGKTAARSDVVITSYALAWRDEDEFRSIRWAAVVADEAQNLKNPFAKQSAFLKQLDAQTRIALTGTPIENRLSDLWSIMDFLNPGYLPAWPRFREKFARPIETGTDERMTGALVRALSPVLLRRVKTDRTIITDLPDKIEKTEWCFLTPEQATLYKAQVDESIRDIESKEAGRRFRILATITRLKQICNHPANFLKDSAALAERSGKVQRLRELAGQMAACGESCLVFTQYAEMGAMLSEDLRKETGAPVSFIHGGVPRPERDKIIAEFQGGKAGEPAILVLSLKAGGTGLNLTKATNVIHFDRWWNPAVENQATDRAYRIGQKSNVMVFKFVTKGTIEERIEGILESKKALADRIVGSGEAMLAGLDTGKLRELMAYRDPEA